MGYTLEAFAIQLSEIENALGSGNQDLLVRILEESQSIDEAGEDEFDEDDEIPLGLAVRELIVGNVRRPNENSQYGYALREICDQIGKPLSSDEWEGVHYAVLGETGVDKLTSRHSKCAFDYPLVEEGEFPIIAFIENSAIDSVLSEISKNTISGELLNLIDELRGWLDTAKEDHTDLVLFYS